MPIAKISWKGELTDRQRELLNDLGNVMGMQAAADEGLIPQEQVDAETARLEAKYQSNIGGPA